MTDTDMMEAPAPAGEGDLLAEMVANTPAVAAALGRELVSVNERALLPAPLGQLREVAGFLAGAGPMVPKWLRGNEAGALAIAYQAARWGLDPVAVASKAYQPKSDGQVGYEAQLVMALINARAPLRHPLKIAYHGDGQDRYCTVTGHLKGSPTPDVVASPRLGNIRPKNSPLWFTDPDQQLAYYTGRAWARRHSPQTLLGIYTPEELTVVSSAVEDVTPKRALDLYEDTEVIVDAEFTAVPSGGNDYKAPANSGSSSDPRDGGYQDGGKPSPSGGKGHRVADKGRQNSSADLGANPWPQVDDIMEWVAIFGGQLEKAPDTAALDKLIAQAQGFGLLPRLKRESKADWDTLSQKAADRRVELVKEGEAKA